MLQIGRSRLRHHRSALVVLTTTALIALAIVGPILRSRVRPAVRQAFRTAAGNYPLDRLLDSRPRALEAARSVDEIKERYGLARVVKLASNENPLGASPLVKRVLARKADTVFRYPRAGNPALVAALAIGGPAVVAGELHPRLLAVIVLTPLALHEVYAEDEESDDEAQ